MENNANIKNKPKAGKKWVMIAGIVFIVLLCIGVFAVLRMPTTPAITCNGRDLKLGQFVTQKELEDKCGLIVELEHANEFLNPNPVDYEAHNADRSVVIQLLTVSGGFEVLGWSIKSENADINWNGIEIGDSYQKVHQVFPEAEMDYFSSSMPAYFFYVTENGNVLNSRQMWEIWDEADEDEKDEVAKKYAVVRITILNDRVYEMSLKYVKVN